jgi:CHAT domain-containing protein/tetratricopeptide (TPR) repeat protein
MSSDGSRRSRGGGSSENSGERDRLALLENSIDSLARAVDISEQLKRVGDYVAALRTLNDAVVERCFGEAGANFGQLAVDTIALEKLSDLAILFGETEAADDLLAAITDLYATAGNQYFAIYAKIKRIRLALVDDIDAAYILLKSLVPELDDLSITSEGLLAWEFNRFGRDDDFSRVREINRRGDAIWRTRDSDQIVTVAGEAGYGPDGRAYVWVEGSSTAVPKDEIVFDTPLFTTGVDRALLVSSLYLEMGRVLAGFGQYGDALIILNRGLSVTKDAPESFIEPVVVHLRLVIAEAHLQKGDLAKAQENLSQLRQEFDDALYPGVCVRAEELLGKLDLTFGRFGAALEKFEGVLDRCQKLGFTRAALVAALNRAHAMIYLNQTGRAREILGRVRDAAAQRGDRALELRAEHLIEVAYARGNSLADGVAITPSVTERRRQEDTSAREPNISRSPLELPAVSDFLSFFEDRVLGFHWYLGNSDLASTECYLTEITEVFHRSDSTLVRLRLSAMKGILCYYQGKYADALAILVKAANELGSLGMEPELWQTQRFIRWCSQKLGCDSEEALLLARETEMLLSRMADSLTPEDREIFLLNKWTADEEYLASEIEKLSDVKAAANRARGPLRWIRRLRVMTRLHKLLVYIDQYKARAAGEALSPTNRQQLRKLGRQSFLRTLLGHPRDRHTIAFLVLPDRVFVASIGWLSMDFGVNPLTRLQLSDIVSSWHDPTKKPGGRDLSSFPEGFESESGRDRMEGQRRTSAQLAEELQITSILEFLPRRVRALTIVPDDSLHAFPFAALIHRDKYLIERYPIALSLRLFGHKASKHAPVTDALMIAVSKRVYFEERHFHGLPGTIKELTRLEPLFKKWGLNVRRLDDDQSGGPGKETVLAELERVGLAHIACHGIFKPERPDQSGMLLQRNGQTELLSLRDLMELRLNCLRHITLSACSLMDALVLPTRRIISLPETLLHAGAGSVLANLWPIDDAISVEMMQRFYENLKHSPADAALQQAQLACLRGEIGTSAKDTDDPVSWAGSCLYGDVGQFLSKSGHRRFLSSAVRR